MASPVLLSVALALPPTLAAVADVALEVSDLLAPRTLDAALFCDLRRVQSVFGASRRVSVGAMDGAAARGRLDVVQRLHATRPEGCSIVALTGAAAGGHLDVLQWLREAYPALHDPEACLKAAAEHNRLAVIRYMRRQVTRDRTGPALEVAAANGYVEAVEALLPGPFDMAEVFTVAAANGQVGMLQFLIAKGHDNAHLARCGLDAAASGGHIQCMELFLPKCDQHRNAGALVAAARCGQAGAVKMLLSRSHYNGDQVSYSFSEAAANDHCEVVKLMLEECPSVLNCGMKGARDDPHRDSKPHRDEVNWAFSSAAKRGSITMMKTLASQWSGELMAFDFRSACETRGDQSEVVKLLIETWDAKGYDLPTPYAHAAAKLAVLKGDVALAKLVVSRCYDWGAATALTLAVTTNQLDMAAVFAARNGLHNAEALVKAATTGRREFVELLLNYSSRSTIQEALRQFSSGVDAAMLTLVLEKCNRCDYGQVITQAAARGFVALVKQLLNKVHDRAFSWALMSAASNGHDDVVRVMLERNNPQAVGCALQAAATQGQLRVIELLRAQCNLTDISDALAIAEAYGHADVVQLLRGKRGRVE
ncbi:unnamed protein product [Phytophthora lilii]|uniref:Unnamed protein product n=1 Tax=Phytophthora lilii TaxID=2077276 RepID=A0A9W7CRN3_9STRA|nr:unnamed protein product [Phytophthora lilii]